MIKYLELTAPESNEFRQAKILSIEVSEGDRVTIGDTLFKVKSGKAKIDLPSTMDGRITEIIAQVEENISVLTPLILLETEVAESTATPPINGSEADDKPGPKLEAKPAAKEVKKKKKAKKTKAGKNATRKKIKKPESADHEQQSLNLSGSDLPEIAKDRKDGNNHESAIAAVVQPDVVNDPKSDTDNADIKKSKPMSNIKVTVPDIGTDSAKVIEILVDVGASVAVDDPLITLESDKASMDVPSTHAGQVASITVQVDQDVSEGTVILELSGTGQENDKTDVTASVSEPTAEAKSQPTAAAASPPSLVDVKIPDIGGDAAKVIEILVKPGQSIELEDALVTLESDKASMEVPSTAAGTIESIEVQIDQDVSEGMVIVKVASSDKTDTTADNPPADAKSDAKPSAPQPALPAEESKNQGSPTAQAAPAQATSVGKSHASPSIRRFARELGVDLTKVSGSGRKGRVQKNDVKQFVKGILAAGSTTAQAGAAAVAGTGIPPIPAVDFSKFGEVDVQPLNKIKRLTAANLHRSWLNVPHVTHNDESDISDLESFRKQLNAEYAKQKKDIKLSPLAFIVKAVVKAMQAYPQFNSSLEPGGENLIYKKYFNIGIAVETPNGLVVPVVRDADKKSIPEIATAMSELAAKARDKKLSPADMSGACFTISSLGGIGGTGFTPIVNAPEVAILGVSRSKMQPVWQGDEFIPGMILPLSLSYDHRVIDGAEAARFTRYVASVLEDVRRLAV